MNRVLIAVYCCCLAATTSAQIVDGWPMVDMRASTPAEGMARGVADVIRAEGQYNLATSQAAINATEATSRDIDNRQKWTNTYFEMRRTNEAYRDAARGPRPSMADLVRYAQAGKPAQLSPSQLDSVSGRINWPPLLETDAFATSRNALDALFAQRAAAGLSVYGEHLQVRQHTDNMLAELAGMIRQVPPSDYMAAKRFVESLAFEARRPAS